MVWCYAYLRTPGNFKFKFSISPALHKHARHKSTNDLERHMFSIFQVKM